MKTIKTYSSLLLFFALIFFSACTKDEVTNPSVFEVKLNGVVTPMEHGEVYVTRIYRGYDDKLNTNSELLELVFYISNQEFICNNYAYQYKPSVRLNPGVFPTPYLYTTYPPRAHRISALKKNPMMPFPVTNSQFEITNVIEEASRLSLTFSYKIVRSPGDSVSVSGRLVNVPYVYNEWKREGRW